MLSCRDLQPIPHEHHVVECADGVPTRSFKRRAGEIRNAYSLTPVARHVFYRVAIDRIVSHRGRSRATLCDCTRLRATA